MSVMRGIWFSLAFFFRHRHRRAGNDVVFQWSSVANRSYQVRFKPTRIWSDVGAPVVAKGPFVAQTYAVTPTNGFFRVKLNE